MAQQDRTGRDRIGRRALIHYKGGVAGEEVLDDRSSGEPLCVVLGNNAVPRGIEAALYEMEVGESRTLTLVPEEGYGYPSPDGIQWYPRTMIKDGPTLKVGDVIALTNKYEQHDALPGLVVEATEDLLRIDANHPFAGKTLSYWLKLEQLL